jgi:very-short-patch-repair endonuclease
MGLIFNRKHQKRFRQHLRTHSTESEILIWLGLKGRQCEGLKFRRQHGIRQYVADFYCPELRLVIEIDGSSHDSPEAQEYDKRRQQAIESHHIVVLRCRDEAVRGDPNRVLEDIRRNVREMRQAGRGPVF